jgi:hypothetical protein
MPIHGSGEEIENKLKKAFTHKHFMVIFYTL